MNQLNIRVFSSIFIATVDGVRIFVTLDRPAGFTLYWCASTNIGKGIWWKKTKMARPWYVDDGTLNCEAYCEQSPQYSYVPMCDVRSSTLPIVLRQPHLVVKVKKSTLFQRIRLVQDQVYKMAWRVVMAFEKK